MAENKPQQKNNSNLILGVDDAGRGCVIGNMVLAGCIMMEEGEAEFKKLGIKDSKLLSPLQREKLVETIKEKAMDTYYFMATPIEIDTGFGMGLNLNQVEALAAASIINELTRKLSSEQKSTLKIILDCPSINTAGWKNQLMEYVKEKSLEKNIVCEHKADFYYPVVSAASIIAKTTRDAEIEKLKEKYKVDFGSGYPADPYTKEFLKENALNPIYEGLFRKSWATWQAAANLKDKKPGKQATLF
jgi:ribonuclease HII